MLLLDLLKRIGLSDLEARCYVALNEEKSLTGYEVAKRVSVSRTNVYSALRSLMDKGACRLIEGDPVQYDAVPIEQLVRHLRSEFDQTSERLVQELKAPARDTSSFYNWQGTRALEQAIGRLAANAEHTIIADVWAEDLIHMEDSLLAAQRRGVNVILISLGPVQTRLDQTFIHKRIDGATADTPRKFSLLCDSRSALIGGFGGDLKPSALESDHPSICEILKNEFFHDLLMIRIEADFGPRLTEKYGHGYERLREEYLNGNGWRI
ncbi:hypothetical protein LJK87_14800 [Paenibacillus sp. P25]|nr:hypothetical protein LJK87_14800 [Paenibacillus sp. P25]